jgi:hypothetical protein
MSRCTVPSRFGLPLLMKESDDGKWASGSTFQSRPSAEYTAAGEHSLLNGDWGRAAGFHRSARRFAVGLSQVVRGDDGGAQPGLVRNARGVKSSGGAPWRLMRF